MINEFVDINENYIFFSNFNDNQKLYRIDKKFNFIKLSNHNSKFINVKGNWVYFLNKTKDYIMKVKIDGTCEEIIYEDALINQFILHDSYALFTESEQLVKLDLNSCETQKFQLYIKREKDYEARSSSLYNISLNNGKLFFIDDSRKIYNISISSFEQPFRDAYENLLTLNNTTFEELKKKINQYKMQINDISDIEAMMRANGIGIPLIYGENNLIKKTNNVLEYIIKENYIYYIKAQSRREVEWSEIPIYCGNLYRIDLSNNSIKKIVNKNVFSLYATEDLVAYINADDNYKLTIHSSSFNKVIDIEGIVNINGNKDKLYFYDTKYNFYEMTLRDFKILKLI